MGLFGFLGTSKSTSDSKGTLDQTTLDAANKTQNDTTSQQQNKSTTASGTQDGTQSGVQTGSNTGQQSSSTATQGTTATNQQLYSDANLGVLDKLFKDFSANGTMVAGADNSLVNAAMNQASAFDPTAYVNDTMTAASQNMKNQIDPAMKIMQSAFGGTTDSNSAAALLNAQTQTQAQSQLAGIRADATAKANGIGTTLLNAAQAIGHGALSGVTDIGNLLKGAVSTGTQKQDQTGTAAQNTAGTTAANTAQTSAQKTTSQEDSQQQLLQIMQSLMDMSSKSDVSQKTTGHQEGTQTASPLSSMMGLMSMATSVAKMGG